MERGRVVKIFLIIVILVIGTVAGIFMYNKYKDNSNNIDNEEHDLIPKKYKVNEYNLVNITDKQKANIYLIDYRNELISNREKAYNHLNSEYKDAKFPTIEEFNNYINTINVQNISLEKYSFSTDGNFLEIYYSNDNSFIFKIKGILDYEVYFDDTTVEMK